MCNKIKPWAEFVAVDMFGYPYNCKYPPDFKRYGSAYEGYPSSNQSVFFYDFCIQQYGVAFRYDDCCYEAEFTDDGLVLTNRTSGEVQGPFDDAMELVEKSEINGTRLIDIIEEVEDVVLH